MPKSEIQKQGRILTTPGPCTSRLRNPPGLALGSYPLVLSLLHRHSNEPKPVPTDFWIHSARLELLRSRDCRIAPCVANVTEDELYHGGG